MKGFSVIGLAAVLLALGIPQAARAKALTVKLIVSGGGLTKPIEITDKRVLGVSDVWVGTFLDTPRGALKDPPQGHEPYEITFYVKFARNDVRKAYVIYYFANPSGESGYIYLPGKGNPWQDLNSGTIIRDGQDGKWNYASPEWEEAIKAAIARAEASRHHGS
jgi:hypothetical protein